MGFPVKSRPARFGFPGVLALFFLLITGIRPAGAQELVRAEECRVRAGLPYFFRKLADRMPVKIAYLGGSITEAGGGWREQSVAWFQSRYPQTPIESINAAIGGTGSDLGVFRLREQVLNHRPDLVFVEFAVNDNGKPAERIMQAMEGIVRQIRRADPKTDICFVYTVMASMAPTLSAGRFPESASTMERVADHYGIPSVHLGLEVIRLADRGELVFRGKPDEFPGKLVFSPDNVHPYAQTGHRLYTEALARSMTQIADRGGKRKSRLPDPLRPDHWEQARMENARKAGRTGGWTVITPATDTVARRLANRFSSLLKAGRPGERLRVRFRGTQLGLYDVMGPGCGQYRVFVDGQEMPPVPRFDEFCTYYRSHYFLLPAVPMGDHVVEFELDDRTLDKAAILARRNQTIPDPKPYEPKNGYAGQLLIIGELLDDPSGK
ncbi:SGNH/GDSL hydrolase family protein [Larkinella soli]|uniref:SGNH/GDSL hydrolase family protein n=1 Tax=Larkinella soli TaxID=1770527 RepID=UPI0013E33C7F|nr:SGNH/GDSL hydrolase family protein [Larkinella soli]